MKDVFILINNVEIFNGNDENTIIGNILIKNNFIENISKVPIPIPENSNCTIIEGRGQFVMPGLIDAHWHAYLCCNTMMDLLTADVSYTHLIAGKEAQATLLRGFTTIRDTGGPVFGLKRAIDTSLLIGPRIYPSGSIISQTAGHADYSMVYEDTPGCACCNPHTVQIGVSRVANGIDAVTTATRDNLKKGASQIKLTAGGGAASLYDPLDVTEFFEEEIRAAVKAADDWGTYVMVHVYNSKGIRRAIRAGVKSIEHGHLIDEDTMKYLVDSDVWLSMQPFTIEDNTYPSALQQAKHIQICEGTNHTYELAKKYNPKLAWGTDLLFKPENTINQNKGIVKLQKWFSNFEILKMVTSTNAKFLSMSGNRNPYPHKLGVIEQGAYADLLLINGNPLQNLELLSEPNANIKVIIKDGVIYKNEL